MQNTYYVFEELVSLIYGFLFAVCGFRFRVRFPDSMFYGFPTERSFKKAVKTPISSCRSS